MMRPFVFAATVLMLGVSVGAAGIPRLPNSLRAEWHFSEGAGTAAGDSSGSGATGTLVNGALWTTGKIGIGVCLDGINDYVALPAGLGILQNASSATVAGWIKLDSMPASGVFREIVSISVNSGAPTNTSRLALAVVGDGTTADLFAGGRSTDSEPLQSALGNADLVVGTWVHVAAVVDFTGDSIRLYRNGVLLTTQAVAFSAAATPNTPSTNAALGAQDTGDSNFFHGCLDEIRVYNRSLSTSELERLATGDGLAAHWGLDEGAGSSAGDSSGNNYIAALQGGPAWTLGQHEGGLHFDGIDDHLSLGSDLSLLRNVNAATVTAWIRPASVIPAGSFREIVSISVNSGGPTNISRVALALRGDGTAGDLYTGGRSTDTEAQQNLADKSNLAVGQWVHVAGVIDFAAGTLRLYRNGSQTASGARPFLQSHTPNTGSTSASIGAQDTGDSNFFHGDLDDVRIYDRALSAQEIHDLVMNDCLMAHWTFDEGSGKKAADSSGNGLTADLRNKATWAAGQLGGAVSLDGKNDYVRLPKNLSILRKAPAATLAGWIKLSSLPASGEFRELIAISVEAHPPSNTSRATLAIVGDGTSADLFAGGRSSDTESQQSLLANVNLGVNTFVHVATVLDFGGDSIKIYVNGALAASSLVNFSQATTADTRSTSAALGAQDTGDSNFFHGLLDDVRIYCRALSSSEIQALATPGVPAVPTGLTAVAGDTTASLSWNASPGATSYNVYRRLQGQPAFGPAIANVAQPGFVDVGLTNGVTVEYAVSALNAAGQSALSSPPVAVTPNPTGQPPAKPVLLTATQTTSDNTPDILGSAEPGSTVTVFFMQGASVIETLVTTATFQGNWSVAPSPKGDGAYTVLARASNAFGASPDSDPITITVDTGIPSVTNVTSTTPDGAYAAGSAINVTVNFSEPVTLAGGNLLVTLDTGAVAALLPFGPSSVATGTVIVAAGQNSLDLNAVSPLTLAAGATLRDSAANNAALSIPAGQNLGDLKNIRIDTIAPALTSITSTTANGTYSVGAAINITVTFSEPVTLAGGNLLVTLDTGAVVSLAPFGPSTSAAGTYVVAAGHSSADLTSVGPPALQAGATLIDGAGNPAILAIPAGQNLGNLKNISIDTSIPTLPMVTTVTSTTLDGFYPVGSAINITITFSKPVTLTGGNLLVPLDTTALVSIAPFGPSASASGTYTVLAGHNSPDLTALSPLTLSAGATLRDSSNNDSLLAIPAPGNLGALKNLMIDTGLPVLANPAPSPGSTVPNVQPTISAGWSDGLSGVVPATATLRLDGVDVTAAATLNAAGFTHVPSLPLTNGLHTVLAEISDQAGNRGQLTWTFTVGAVEPAPSITSPAAGALFTTSTVPVAGGSSAPGRTIRVLVDGSVAGTTVSGAGGAWSLTLGTVTDGNHSLTATSTNGSTSPPSSAVAIKVDTAPPVIAGFVPANGSTVTVATPTISASWSDGVTGINLATAAITLDGAAVAGASLTPSGLSFTPAALGNGLHQVQASIRDGAGLLGTAAWSFTVNLGASDSVAPTVQILTVPDGGATNDPTPDLTASVTDLGGSNLTSVSATLDGAAAGAVITFVQANHANVSFTPSALTEGSHVFQITAIDGSGNVTTRASTFKVDLTLPTISATLTPSDPVEKEKTIKVAFSDAFSGINDFSLAVLVDLENGLVGNGTLGPGTFTITTEFSVGSHSVVAEIRDNAGNVRQATLNFQVTEGPDPDTEPPTVEMTYPDFGVQKIGGQTLQVLVVAKDRKTPADTGVSLVELLVNGAVVQSMTSAQALDSFYYVFPLPIPAAPSPDLVLTARATDGAGNVGTTVFQKTVTVTPLPVNRPVAFQISGIPNPVTADAAFFVTITPVNAQGQPVGFTGFVSVRSNLQSFSTFEDFNGETSKTVNFSIRQSGVGILYAQSFDVPGLLGSGLVRVVARPVATLTIDSVRNIPLTGNDDLSELRVLALDSLGNPVTGASLQAIVTFLQDGAPIGSSTFQLTTGPDGVVFLPSLTVPANATSLQVSASAAGGTITGSHSEEVLGDVLFRITFNEAVATAGTPVGFTIAAINADTGALASNYTGTVYVYRYAKFIHGATTYVGGPGTSGEVFTVTFSSSDGGIKVIDEGIVLTETGDVVLAASTEVPTSEDEFEETLFQAPDFTVYGRVTVREMTESPETAMGFSVPLVVLPAIPVRISHFDASVSPVQGTAVLFDQFGNGVFNEPLKFTFTVNSSQSTFVALTNVRGFATGHGVTTVDHTASINFVAKVESVNYAGVPKAMITMTIPADNDPFDLETFGPTSPKIISLGQNDQPVSDLSATRAGESCTAFVELDIFLSLIDAGGSDVVFKTVEFESTDVDLTEGLTIDGSFVRGKIKNKVALQPTFDQDGHCTAPADYTFSFKYKGITVDVPAANSVALSHSDGRLKVVGSSGGVRTLAYFKGLITFAGSIIPYGDKSLEGVGTGGDNLSGIFQFDGEETARGLIQRPGLIPQNISGTTTGVFYVRAMDKDISNPDGLSVELVALDDQGQPLKDPLTDDVLEGSELTVPLVPSSKDDVQSLSNVLTTGPIGAVSSKPGSTPPGGLATLVTVPGGRIKATVVRGTSAVSEFEPIQAVVIGIEILVKPDGEDEFRPLGNGILKGPAPVIKFILHPNLKVFNLDPDDLEGSGGVPLFEPDHKIALLVDEGSPRASLPDSGPDEVLLEPGGADFEKVTSDNAIVWTPTEDNNPLRDGLNRVRLVTQTRGTALASARFMMYSDDSVGVDLISGYLPRKYKSVGGNKIIRNVVIAAFDDDSEEDFPREDAAISALLRKHGAIPAGLHRAYGEVALIFPDDVEERAAASRIRSASLTRYATTIGKTFLNAADDFWLPDQTSGGPDSFQLEAFAEEESYLGFRIHDARAIGVPPAQGMTDSGTHLLVSGDHGGAYLIEKSSGVVSPKFPSSGRILASVVEGTRAYVGDQNLGILVYDLSTSPPTLNATVKVADSPTALRVQGSVLFVGRPQGVDVLDVTNLSAVQLLSSIAMPATVADLDFRLGLLSIATREEGVHFYNVVDPRNPALMTALPAAEPVESITGVGSILYWSEGINGIRIVDASNAASPQLVGTLTGVGAVRSLRVQGTTLVAAFEDFGVHLYDLTNPAAPALLNQIPIAGGANTAVLSGATLFLTQSFPGVVQASASTGQILGSFAPQDEEYPVQVDFVNLSGELGVYHPWEKKWFMEADMTAAGLKTKVGDYVLYDFKPIFTSADYKRGKTTVTVAGGHTIRIVEPQLGVSFIRWIKGVLDVEDQHMTPEQKEQLSREIHLIYNIAGWFPPADIVIAILEGNVLDLALAIGPAKILKAGKKLLIARKSLDKVTGRVIGGLKRTPAAEQASKIVENSAQAVDDLALLQQTGIRLTKHQTASLGMLAMRGMAENAGLQRLRRNWTPAVNGFDDVYHNVKDGTVFIMEAKGGTAGLAKYKAMVNWTSNLAEKPTEKVYQMSRRWVEITIAHMKTSPHKADREMADLVAAALRDKKLKGYSVTAKIKPGQFGAELPELLVEPLDYALSAGEEFLDPKRLADYTKFMLPRKVGLKGK